MPYIDEADRPRFDGPIRDLVHEISTSGELNYVITCLLRDAEIDGLSGYAHLNAKLGVPDAAAREFYRRVVAPYEDQKIRTNGDVYPGKVPWA